MAGGGGEGLGVVLPQLVFGGQDNLGIISLLPRGSQGLNSGHQASQQLTTDPSLYLYRLLCFVLFCDKYSVI